MDDTVYGCSLSVEGLTVIRQDVQSETVLQQILIMDVDEVYGLVAALIQNRVQLYLNEG